ncbi:MAG: aldehyde dehydrogenase family protein, partial [Flavobacteriaceae bacterium]|nr:aldehyde dehydrogenase family protein [Flavobacteriaceae bacterium]
MSNGFFNVPKAINEPIKSYKPGSPEIKELIAEYKKQYNQTIEVPLYIGNQAIKTSKKATMSPPHDHKHLLGHYYLAEKVHVDAAIQEALSSHARWSRMDWKDRAAIFLKAAELIAGPYRAKIN